MIRSDQGTPEEDEKFREAIVRLPVKWQIPSSILTWPELSGEAKVAAAWLWNNMGGKPGHIMFRMTDVAAAQGKNHERSARRWIGYLVDEGLVEILHNERGLYYAYVSDPDEVYRQNSEALIRRATESQKSVKGKPRKKPPTKI